MQYLMVVELQYIVSHYCVHFLQYSRSYSPIAKILWILNLVDKSSYFFTSTSTFDRLTSFFQYTSYRPTLTSTLCNTHTHLLQVSVCIASPNPRHYSQGKKNSRHDTNQCEKQCQSHRQCSYESPLPMRNCNDVLRTNYIIYSSTSWSIRLFGVRGCK